MGEGWFPPHLRDKLVRRGFFRMLGEFLILQAFEYRERPGPKGTSESFPRGHVDMKGRVGVI